MRAIISGRFMMLYLVLVLLMCGIGFSAGYKYRAYLSAAECASIPDTSRAFTYTDERKAAELEERLLRAEAEIKSMKAWRLKLERERRGNAGKSGNMGTH